jgi:hypothetical protein
MVLLDMGGLGSRLRKGLELLHNSYSGACTEGNVPNFSDVGSQEHKGTNHPWEFTYNTRSQPVCSQSIDPNVPLTKVSGQQNVLFFQEEGSGYC